MITAIAVLTSGTLIAPAAASHFEDVQEVSALDGVGAAVAWSNLAFPDGAGAALLGRADLFADSLAAGSLQGQRPLLLTDSTKLSAATKDELDRLNVTSVTILGGTSAVAESVADELRTLGYSVNRLSGANRIETAVAVGRTRTGAARTALLARAFGTSDPTAAFADALSVGAWAADTGWPVLLTESERLSAQTAAFMRENVDQVYAVGGNAAISETVLTEIRALGVAVRRVSGPSRFDTAVAVADARGFSSASDAAEVVLIDGQSADSWTDGFPAAAYAAGKNAPVVLGNSGSGTLPPVTKTFLAAGPGADLVTGWTVPSAQTDEAAEAMGKSVADTGVFQVRMTGRNVVRPSEDATTPVFGHGQPGATGLLTLTADQEAKTLDYVFQGNAEGPYIPTFEKSSGLMLRKAAADQRGPVSVVFPSPGDNGKGSGTVGESTFQEGFVLADFMAKPDAFYAEAATQKFAGGAIRGQLPGGGERHLPAQPDFISITSGQNDDRVTLNFASPVYAPVVGETGLKADHFSVTVADVHSAQVSSVDVATTARDARPTVHLKLNRTAVSGKTTTVALTAAGAGFIQNNLAAKPLATTQSQVTPSDIARPDFQAIEALGEASAVTLKFSEPVWVKDLVAPSELVVKSKIGTAERTHAVASNIATSSTAMRTDKIAVALTDAIPSGSEVLVTVKSSVKTKILDVAGNLLNVDSDVTRAVATAGGKALQSATFNDLVFGKGRFDANRAQDLQITAVVEGAMDAGQKFFLLTPPTSSGVWFERARPELTYAGGTGSITFTRDGTSNRWNSDVLPVALPSGTLVTLSIHDVSVTATAAGGPVEVRLGRADSQATVAATPRILSGVQVTSSPVLPAGSSNYTQALSFALKGDMTGTAISIDLSKLVEHGVDYQAVPDNGVTGSGFSSPTWAGAPRTRLNVVPTVKTADHPLVISIAGVKVPSKRVENIPITITRTGDSSAASTVHLMELFTRDIFDVRVVTAPTWSQTSTLKLGFKLRGALDSGTAVKIDLSKSGFTFASPAVKPIPAGGGTVSDWLDGVVTYTPPAGGPAGEVTLEWTTASPVNPVDTRTAWRTWFFKAWRTDETRDVDTVFSTVQSGLQSSAEVLLQSAFYSPSSDSGTMSNAGETMTLVFSHDLVSIASNAKVSYWAVAPGTGDKANPGQSTEVSCSTLVKCEIDPVRRNVATITVQPTPQGGTPPTPVPDVKGKNIRTLRVTGFGTFNGATGGSTTVVADVFDNLRPITATNTVTDAQKAPPSVPPP